MADLVCLIPGILGTQLWRLVGNARQPSPIWLNYDRLGLYGFDQLRLTPDGQEFDPMWRGRVSIGEPLPLYYGVITYQLERDGFEVVNGGYDWRLDLDTSATALAARLLARFPGRPIHLLGYSLGGLIGRLVAKAYAAAGQGALVKRLLTLGAPHFGSYAPVVNFLRRGDFYAQIANWIRLRNALGGTVGFSRRRMDPGMCSWPSMYQLFPFLPGPGSDADPFRAALYEPASWSVVQPEVIPARITAIQAWQADFVSVVPGGGVFVQAVGTGLPTPASLRSPNLLTPDLFADQVGDGTVPLSFATIPNAPTYRVPSTHEALIRHPRVLADVAWLLRDGLIGELNRGGPVVT